MKVVLFFLPVLSVVGFVNRVEDGDGGAPLGQPYDAFIKEEVSAVPGIEPDLGLQGGACFGLPGKMCKPCGGTENLLGMCDEAQTECANLFCHPLCTESTLTCTVDFLGDFAMYSDPIFVTAICRQILAFVCADAGCCKKPGKPGTHSLLLDWVEDAVYGGDSGMDPLIPLPFCRFNHLDKDAQEYRCNQCQKDVKLSIEPLDNTEGCYRHFGPSSPGADQQTFEEEPVDPAPKPDEGQHSLLARCLALAGKIAPEAKKSLGGKKVCECLGCCKPPDADASCILPTHWLTYPEPE